MGARPGRPGPRRLRPARPLRALADVDVGQRGGGRLPGLAARVEPVRRPGGAGRVLRPRRLLAVGLAAGDHRAGSRPTHPTRSRRRCRHGGASRRTARTPTSTPGAPGWCRSPARATSSPCSSRSAGRPLRRTTDDEEAFDAAQNAEVAADAEHYYRIMVRGDRQSWNIRDHHMVDTIDRLAHHLGPASKGLVWEHNTHVGDARATDMARDGLVNVGQLRPRAPRRRGRRARGVRLPPAAR